MVKDTPKLRIIMHVARIEIITYSALKQRGVYAKLKVEPWPLEGEGFVGTYDRESQRKARDASVRIWQNIQ